MREDEFNSFKPVNEDSSRRVHEFSHTPKSESFFQKENKEAPSFNSSHTKNDSVKENTFKASQRKGYAENITKSVKATSVATAGHAAVVAATVISVTTVSTVVGISVVSENKINLNFTDFSLSSERLDYRLELEGVLDEKDPFFLYVRNENYSQKVELHEGINEGTFDGLGSKQVYNVAVRQERYGGKNLYEDSFTSVEISRVYGVRWDRMANYLTHTIDFELNYVDDRDVISDIFFQLKEEEQEEPYRFVLNKTREMQSIDIANLGDLEDRVFQYNVSYLENGEPRETEWLETFIDDCSLGVSRVHGIKWDKTADFENNTFDIELIYVDDFNRFSDFKLLLSPMATGTADAPDPVSFDIEKKNGVQTISYDDSELFIETMPYTYRFSYLDKGVEVVMPNGEGEITFKNNNFVQHDPEFIGVDWDHKVTLGSRLTTLSLNYIDPDNRLSEFVLHMDLADWGDHLEYPLDKTLDPQTIFLDGLEMVDSSITVSAYIMYKDSETVSSFDLGTVVLEPTGSNFSYFEINPNAKFYSRTFDVFLGYEDPDGNLSDFTLTFEYEGKNYDVALQAISDSQTAEFPSDIELDEETTYPYTFTYHDAELGEDVAFESGSVQFTDLEKGSITELLWPKTANSKTREFTFGVDVLDPLGRISDVTLFLQTSGSADGVEFPLDVIGEEQTFETVDPTDGSYIIDIFSSLYYEVRYVYDGTKNLVYESGMTSFSPISASGITGLNCDFTISSTDYMMAAKMEFSTPSDKYSGYTFHVLDGDTEVTSKLFGEEGQKPEDWVYLGMADYSTGSDYCVNLNQEYDYQITAFYYDETTGTGEDEIVYSGKATFTEAEEPVVYGGRVISQEIVPTSPQFGLQILYFQKGSHFSNTSVRVSNQDGEAHVYDYELPDPRQNYTYVDMSTSVAGSYDAEAFARSLSSGAKIEFMYTQGSIERAITIAENYEFYING